MSWPKHVWDQIKGISKDDLIRALERDGWTWDNPKAGSMRIYVKPPGGRVSVHYHAGHTMGAGLLKGLLADIGWTEADLRRIKLIK